MAEPIRNPPTEEGWPHFRLWSKVQEALRALPGYFQTKTNIEGVLATDIFTLNSALGAAIEEQVVSTLNSMRSLWDPERQYTAYLFARQSQTFPDVLLRKRTNEGRYDVLFGIELKGWYLLAKEKEPNFRFRVNREACDVPDLIVTVPWVLSNVLSGTPMVHQPYIELARYSADYRTHWWQVIRRATGSPNIKFAAGVAPYPKKSDKIDDVPEHDSGRNFGRMARTGIMDSFIAESLDLHLSGIPAREWISFFSRFVDNREPDVEEERE